MQYSTNKVKTGQTMIVSMLALVTTDFNHQNITNIYLEMWECDQA